MEDKRVRYAQAVWHITQELRDADDLEEALGSCLEIVTETLRCAVSVVWLLDARCGLIHPMFYHGEANVRGHVIARGEGIIGSVVQTGVSVMVEGATDESHFSQVPSASGSGVCNMLCVPLQNAYEIIGCIEVRYHLDGSPLDEHDLSLCEELAALAAVAIEERGLVLDFGPPHPVIVSLRDVSKSFDGGGGRVHALKGVNLDIYEGEFMVILGESGCGKTTLLNIVGGLETLSEGMLTVRGRDYSTSGSGELLAYRRDHVGYVFQEYHLMPNLSALENVEFVTEIVKDALSAREALHLVGLDERAGNFPSQLSGGQQQRVSIARALAKRPELILADEPTAALDYHTSIEVLAVMERLVREQGNTVIMVTHNPEIAKMADRVVRMRDGCLTSIQRNHHPRHANELVW